jgi:hypothetical protein
VKTMEWTNRDKSEWARGPWDHEPDKMQWQDEATGLPCLIVRGPAGALCGYVGVGPTHPWFGIGYSECPSVCEDVYCDHSPGAAWFPSATYKGVAYVRGQVTELARQIAEVR